VIYSCARILVSSRRLFPNVVVVKLRLRDPGVKSRCAVVPVSATRRLLFICLVTGPFFFPVAVYVSKLLCLPSFPLFSPHTLFRPSIHEADFVLRSSHPFFPCHCLGPCQWPSSPSSSRLRCLFCSLIYCGCCLQCCWQRQRFHLSVANTHRAYSYLHFSVNKSDCHSSHFNRCQCLCSPDQCYTDALRRRFKT
jgi:hypothetical protein